jgi:proline iminopeptidase
MRRSLVVALSALTVACTSTPARRADEGFITVEGGRIWYHRVGTGTGTPLVLLHGGPGSASYALKPLLALGNERPVIIYDQLGSGKSDRPTDTTLFTVERYVRELQALRDSLGLAEVHI